MDVVDINYQLYESSYSTVYLRIFPDRMNPLEKYSNANFQLHFRLDKTSFLDLLNDLNFDSQRNRHCDIPPVLQLAVSLQFYATGTYQYVIGELHDLSQPSICRIIRRISRKIAHLSRKFVMFPQSVERKSAITRSFQEKLRIPSVLGAIDCTHVRIKKPKVNGEIYINRKGYPSLNIQMVSSCEYEILNIVARYAGSAHDSRIYNNSHLKRRFEGGDLRNFKLIGDQGYACSSVLLTPIRFPCNDAERRYNEHLTRARSSVERCFGILKARFRVLGPDSRIRLLPQTTTAVIVACAVLHNICIFHGINFNETDLIMDNIDVNENETSIPPPQRSIVRAEIINRFFR